VIHLIYGKDQYRVRKSLEATRERLAADDDMLGGNTTVLDGRGLTPQELMAHATAVPFLAASRLVVVEGLLASLGQIKRGRAKKNDPADPLEPWRQVAAALGDKQSLPETTTLVFVEGELAKNNAAFTIFSPIAHTTEYAELNPGELTKWMRDAAKAEGLKLTEGAEKALVRAIGADLWALASEMRKLSLYAAGATVDESLVAQMVPAAQDTKFWDLTDATVAGNERKAITALGRLLADGEPAPLLSAMLVRQYRQLALVKDLREQRAPAADVARIAGVPPFKVDTVGALAGRYSWEQIRAAYGLLLESDLNVKRGLQGDESALQLVVHQLCALCPKAPGRLAYAR
jgi:DNA polymerase-3 subunit delta